MTDNNCTGPLLILEVIEAGKCPLNYQVSDKFKVVYPAIHAPNEKKICFMAMAQAQKAIDGFVKGNSEACFECPACYENRVKFQLYPAPKINALHQQIAEQLKGFSLFRLMKIDELQLIARDIQLKKYQDGETILNVGDPGENFYIIHIGQAEIHAPDRNDPNKYNKVATLGPEDCFGEMSLLTNDSCSTKVTAKGKTTLLCMNKTSFHQMLQECQSINRYFFNLLANRIKQTNDKISRQNLVGGIAGTLSALSVVEIVQIFKSSNSTGILHLKLKDDDAKILINNGEIVSARYLDKLNEEAFFALVNKHEGEFQFEKSSQPFQREIMIPTTGLLMESMRVMDEASS